MRILILDHKSERFDFFRQVFERALSEPIIRSCVDPNDFPSEERADFDFIALHFSVGNMAEGLLAFAFLNGLFGHTTHRPEKASVAARYYDLGLRVADSWKEPSVLVYSGTGLDQYKAKLASYGESVGITEVMRFDALAPDLELSLQNGRIDMKAFRSDERSYSFLLALLLLCQGYLAVHLDTFSSQLQSDHTGGVSIPGEIAKSLELMTGRSVREAAGTLANILPPALKTRDGADRLREQTCAASWWRVIARSDLSALVKAELWQGGAQEPELGAIEPLLSLIEAGQPIEAVELVASAYNAAVDLLAARMTMGR